MHKDHLLATPSKEDMRRLFSEASLDEDLFLIGGQALAFWMLHYGVYPESKDSSITRDVDFYTPHPSKRTVVEKLARSLGGTAFFPDRRALTALVGQAIRRDGENRLVNVDVVFRVIGLSDAEIRRYAAQIDIADAGTVRVLDPVSVLKSRTENLHQLVDKQNQQGEAQLTWAIIVAQRHLQAARDQVDLFWDGLGRDPILKMAARILSIAESAAGKAVAKRHGLHAADALDPGLIQNQAFLDRRLPQALEMMSEARRSQLAMAAELGSMDRPGMTAA